MSRIPAWLYLLFGAIAIVAGALGVGHAPSGVPKVFWAVITVVGLASLGAACAIGRSSRKRT